MTKKTDRRVKKGIGNFLRKNQRALKVSGGRIASGLLRGDTSVVAGEIQRRIDRAVAKKTRGRGAYNLGVPSKNRTRKFLSGRGAYGRGAYGGAAVNSLFTNSDTLRPAMGAVGDETGRIRVKRREYLTRVVSPSTPSQFTVTSFSINPGLSGVFAWLSQVAANYDDYEMISLIFHFKPVISTASQTGSMGTVLLACNYNAGAVKFESFREMVEYEGAMETRICDPAIFGIECDPSKGQSGSHLFVRAGNVPSDEDIKTYDIGLFQFATADIASDYPAGTLLGHLYVEYEVVLGKPKLYVALGKEILVDNFRCSASSKANMVPSSNVFYNSGNTLGGFVQSGGANILNYILPDNFTGSMNFQLYCSGTMTVGDLAVSVTTFGNISVCNMIGNAGTTNFLTTNDPTTMAYTAYFDVGESAAFRGNYIQIDVSATLTCGNWWLYATKVNPDQDHGWQDFNIVL